MATSAKVKNRYNAKAYDRITIMVPKGQKESIKRYAESQGESINKFIITAINKRIEEEAV